MTKYLFMGGPLDGHWIGTNGAPEYRYPEPDGPHEYRVIVYTRRRVTDPSSPLTTFHVYAAPSLPLNRETAQLAVGRWTSHYLPKSEDRP